MDVHFSRPSKIYLNSASRKDFFYKTRAKNSISGISETGQYPESGRKSKAVCKIFILGNPHSRTHAYGWESEAAMETSRHQVADLINADPKEIIFTSGATESNNISVKGVARLDTLLAKLTHHPLAGQKTLHIGHP